MILDGLQSRLEIELGQYDDAVSLVDTAVADEN